MTAGIESANNDIDNIYAVYISGQTQAASTGVESAGTDLNQRYSALVYGSAAPNSGIRARSTNQDLSAIFAAKGTVTEALSLYPTSSRSVTISASANTLSTSESTVLSGEVYNATAVDFGDTRTGYGLIYSMGTGIPWPQDVTQPSPNGGGWIYDTTALEGLTMLAGTYAPTATLKFNAVAEAIIADVYYRVYKRSSGGAYTQLVACKITNKTFDYDVVTVMATGWTNTTGASATFSVGDKLYVDICVDITANSASDYDDLYVSMEYGPHGALATPGFLAA